MDKDLKPLISVLMPVYNAERFLKEAIDSILSQSLKDFEFIIINDGSTDKSKEIILSFSDPRIVLINNTVNAGVIASLNKGIEVAKGKYIARMDADDISDPERFKIQAERFVSDSGLAVVCSKIVLINAENEEIGSWDYDENVTTEEEIKKTLTKTNCIAHPSVMMVREIAKKYKYKPDQKGSEDWDLWMRMISDGERIIKINQVLLRYRIHSSSVTAQFNKNITSESKLIKVKKRFLVSQLMQLKFKKFELEVAGTLIRSFARDIKVNKVPACMRSGKRLLTLSPFIAYEQFKLLKRQIKEKNNNGIFLFFPYTHVGGAEKVHAAITQSVEDQKPWVFFTGLSQNEKFLPLFKGVVFNIPLAINHPFFAARSNQLILAAIEKHENPVTFGCNNIFYYELTPQLSSKVKAIDLMHDFRFDGEETILKKYLPQFLRYNKRVFISLKAIVQTKKFYRANSVDKTYDERLLFIRNYAEVPQVLDTVLKYKNEQLNVIYVGRGTAEKRAQLVAAIAKKCIAEKIPASFKIVGDVSEAINSAEHPEIEFADEVTNQNILTQIYKKADVLLITSEREGFPMAIMEGMGYGVIPLSTPVGDIPAYINSGKNGFLTSSSIEHETVHEMVSIIKELAENKKLREEISRNAFEFARENFSKEQFENAYNNLLKVY